MGLKDGGFMELIWIVDDDIAIGDVLETALRRQGYRTRRAYSGSEALLLLKNETPDLILLDLMLPALSGEELLERLGGTPVIVLSAKTDAETRVRVLGSGAADYMPKPFDVSELLARIRLRLTSRSADGAVLRFDGIEVDTRLSSAAVDGQAMRLTKTEFAILRLLLLNAGNVVTKSALLDELQLRLETADEASLKVHVSNLRRKLREKSGRDLIEAVWGIGYKL